MSENKSNIPTFKRINAYDYIINKFKAYKTWRMDNTNYNTNYNKVKIYQGLKPSDEYRNGVIPYSSSKYTPNLNTESPFPDKGILWGSINHQFYKTYNEGYNLNRSQDLNLYYSSSIINIPTMTAGEGIKRGTFELIDNSSLSEIKLTDDRKGNIIDGSINTSSFIENHYLDLYLGFNTWADKRNTKIKDLSINKVDVELNGSYKIVPGILTTGLDTGSSGDAFLFNNENFFKIRNNEDWINLNTSDDFSISFWLQTPTEQTVTTKSYNTILSKKREGYGMVQNQKTKIQDNTYYDINTNIYPINISLLNSGSNKISIERNDGVNYTNFTSSAMVNDNLFHHIVLNKTGSNLNLYIDNVLDSTTVDKSNFTIKNNCDWYFGSEGINRNNLSGSLDEFRIYKKALNTTEIFNLYSNDFESGSAYQTNRVGNIFYKNGNVIISDFRKRYNKIGIGDGSQNYSGSGFNLKFNSTQTIYEHEIICRTKPNEFNLTLNPTIRVNNSLRSERPKDFVTGSFSPYITTIGLYNDNYQLVAVAKMSSPIPKRDDIPMNFVIRFDA